MRRFICITYLGLLLLPAQAHAWGAEGHRIACGIAWHRLDAQGRALVAKLLDTNDETSFVEACLWADEVRPRRPETYAYHFINIAASKNALDMARDCGNPQKRCVPWAVAHYARILADTKATEQKRAEALMFVLHFVGDIHQPLHAGRPQDRGGNDVPIDFFGNAGSPERPMNLHLVWDSQILRRANGQWPGMSTRLTREISVDEAARWESLDVVAWTNESYRICEEFVYRQLPADRRLRNDYYYPALGYAEVQLQKAGVRLAYLLNGVAGGATPQLI